MQRINLFPDPNMANTIFKCITVRCTVDFPTVSGFRWLRATTSGSGDIYAQYQLTGVNLPRAGVYHIHSVCYARDSGALFRVYAGVGNGFTLLYETGIADDQTKTIDADITIPANTTQLLIRVVPPSTVGKFILIRDILLESKSTYDTAVGGASALLHGGHDATRIGASVGRVMPDDDHEPDKQSKTQRHAESGRVHADFDHQKADWRRILVHGLAGRVGRLHHDNQLSRHLQQESTHQMGLHGHVIESDGPGIQCRVRQSDRQGVGHGPVRAGRIPGEQGPARRHRIFHRGYDAARLTLMGVVA